MDRPAAWAPCGQSRPSVSRVWKRRMDARECRRFLWAAGGRAVQGRPAEHETGSFTDYETTIAQGDFLAQDLSLAETQQRGLRSMAFEDCYLAGQETRVRRFHEVLNDYLEGRR